MCIAPWRILIVTLLMAVCGCGESPLTEEEKETERQKKLAEMKANPRLPLVKEYKPKAPLKPRGTWQQLCIDEHIAFDLVLEFRVTDGPAVELALLNEASLKEFTDSGKTPQGSTVPASATIYKRSATEETIEEKGLPLGKYTLVVKAPKGKQTVDFTVKVTTQ